MKICISGLTGSGKTVIGKRIAKELNIRHINPTYKSSVENDAELIKLIGRAGIRFTREFDRKVADESKGKDCVITTWYCPWTVGDADLRIWLDLDESKRVKRIMKRNRLSLQYAKKYVRNKDRLTLRNYRLAYGKDYDFSIIDIRINCAVVKEEEIVSIISLLAIERDKKRFA